MISAALLIIHIHNKFNNWTTNSNNIERLESCLNRMYNAVNLAGSKDIDIQVHNSTVRLVVSQCGNSSKYSNQPVYSCSIGPRGKLSEIWYTDIRQPGNRNQLKLPSRIGVKSAIHLIAKGNGASSSQIRIDIIDSPTGFRIWALPIRPDGYWYIIIKDDRAKTVSRIQ